MHTEDMTRQRVIPLHQNESYWLVDEALAELYASSDPRDFSTYPDYAELRALLATYAGVGPHQLLATPGSDSAIRAIAEELKRTGKRALLPIPTFYGYERILKQVDLAIETLPYRERDGQFEFPTEAVLSALEKGIDALFLCTPNNPLGTSIPAVDLERILDRCKEKHVLAIVDEAYFEFSGATSIARLERQPIYVIRTLSKAFGLAGARVGYLLASESRIASLQERQLPWGIAHPSVHAATAAIQNAPKILGRIQLIHAERARFSAELSDISGVTVFESCTNFVLTRVPDADTLKERLSEKGVLVARGEAMSYVPAGTALLKNTIRMSVPSPDDSDLVVEAIRAGL